jgi:tRNA A-37 threonylcarbamoyl transferase component Bud32
MNSAILNFLLLASDLFNFSTFSPFNFSTRCAFPLRLRIRKRSPARVVDRFRNSTPDFVSVASWAKDWKLLTRSREHFLKAQSLKWTCRISSGAWAITKSSTRIGRGGMGVIYLARQRHPQRIVAVKRVLNYHADAHQTLKRFRREADAAASLDHPNILPIYEVSESEDGLPFFSMKFATGGSLQKVGPVLRAEPRKCVQLMAKVARAVEYAHDQGILHRDLKPGNILLDGRGEPLVSDFGLAKWLDANRDLTKSLTTFEPRVTPRPSRPRVKPPTLPRPPMFTVSARFSSNC